MMAKAEFFLEFVKGAINFARQAAYLRKKLYKNNRIDDAFLLPDTNKDDSECVKSARISSQGPLSIFSVNKYENYHPDVYAEFTKLIMERPPVTAGMIPINIITQT